MKYPKTLREAIGSDMPSSPILDEMRRRAGYASIEASDPGMIDETLDLVLAPLGSLAPKAYGTLARVVPEMGIASKGASLVMNDADRKALALLSTKRMYDDAVKTGMPRGQALEYAMDTSLAHDASLKNVFERGTHGASSVIPSKNRTSDMLVASVNPATSTDVSATAAHELSHLGRRQKGELLPYIDSRQKQMLEYYNNMGLTDPDLTAWRTYLGAPEEFSARYDEIRNLVRPRGSGDTVSVSYLNELRNQRGKFDTFRQFLDSGNPGDLQAMENIYKAIKVKNTPAYMDFMKAKTGDIVKMLDDAIARETRPRGLSDLLLESVPDADINIRW